MWRKLSLLPDRAAGHKAGHRTGKNRFPKAHCEISYVPPPDKAYWVNSLKRRPPSPVCHSHSTTATKVGGLVSSQQNVPSSHCYHLCGSCPSWARGVTELAGLVLQSYLLSRHWLSRLHHSVCFHSPSQSQPAIWCGVSHWSVFYLVKCGLSNYT